MIVRNISREECEDLILYVLLLLFRSGVRLYTDFEENGELVFVVEYGDYIEPVPNLGSVVETHLFDQNILFDTAVFKQLMRISPKGVLENLELKCFCELTRFFDYGQMDKKLNLLLKRIKKSFTERPVRVNDSFL